MPPEAVAAVAEEPMTPERLDSLLAALVPDEQLRREIRLAAGAYAAHLVELYARPDNRWGPK